MSSTFAATAAFLFGACFGSFLNVCIVRLPRGESVVHPRSRCPSCERGIRWFENIPIGSWLALRGRCAGCGMRISLLYPAVELVTALLWGLSVWHFGLSFQALQVATFATVLLGVAVTDLRTYTIPDGFTVFGLAFVFIASGIAVLGGDGSLFARPWEALLGACTGAGAIAIAMWLGEWVLKREAMGFGDVTLMAVIGAALGPTRSLLTIFLAALLGTLVFATVLFPLAARRRKASASPATQPAAAGEVTAEAAAVIERSGPAGGEVPFGVFLAPAAMITLLWGDALTAWYHDFITR